MVLDAFLAYKVKNVVKSDVSCLGGFRNVKLYVEGALK